MTPFRQRMLEDMQIRNLAPATQEVYVRQVARFAQHFSKCPSQLGPEEIRGYQVYLIKEQQASTSVLSQAVHAGDRTAVPLLLALLADRRPYRARPYRARHI